MSVPAARRRPAAACWMVGLFVVAALTACASAPAEQRDAAVSSGAIDSGIVASSDANNCAMQPCSILPQCGCTAQTTCDVDTSTSTVCRGYTMGATELSTCDTSGDCEKGYTCKGRDKPSATCKKYCAADSECGTPRGRCAIAISSSATIPEVCSSNCDPIGTTSALCPDTFKCGLATVSSSGVLRQITNCLPAGTLTQGANCKVGTGGNDALCAKGYRCTTTGESLYVCRRYCKRSAPSCPTGTTCIAFNPVYTVDIEYGVCN